MIRSLNDRIKSLHQYGVLDTPEDPAFDQISGLAAEMFGVPIALISFLDETRQWFKSCIGFATRETSLDVAFCAHAIELGPHGVMVVEDATQDPRFANNPLVVGEPHIRFYAGATLTTPDGVNIGTLCAIDTVPRKVPDDKQLKLLRILADQVIDRLELAKLRSALRERERIMDLAELLSGTGHWKLDHKTQQAEWSPGTCIIHGVSPDDFHHRMDDAIGFFTPEDQERVTAIVHEKMALNQGWEFEAEIIRKDGEHRFVKSVAAPQFDEFGVVKNFIGVFRDITEERIASDKISASEKKYRILAENITDVIAVYEHDGIVSYVSPSVKRAIGYDPEDIIGRSIFELILADDLEKVRAKFFSLDNRAALEPIDFRVLTKNNEIRHLESRPSLSRESDTARPQVIDALRDISDRKLREAALEQARTAAIQAARAKANFLANMSHEIRTPMNGVIGFAELLSQTELDEDQARYVEMILRSGNLMMTLLNNVLDLSKIESQKLSIAYELTNIRIFFSDLMGIFGPAAQAKGLKLKLMLDSDLPPTAYLDPMRTRQVLMNLISNAIKFTDAGSVTVSADIDTSGNRDVLNVAVSDTGMGIAAGDLPNVFEQFFQADDLREGKPNGTGLGLAITKELVELMGGEIHAASEPGKGSTFSVTLPVKVEKMREVIAHSAGPDQPQDQSPIGEIDPDLRILVAEDNEINQALILGLGKAMGCHFDIAQNGKEAVEMIEANAAAGTPYGLVLMDVRMPVMNGIEATRHLRENGFGPDRLPIVAVTANAFKEDHDRSLAAGMQAHLSKPITLLALRSAIDQWGLRRQKSEGSPAGLAGFGLEPEQMTSLQQRFMSKKDQALDFFNSAQHMSAVSDAQVEEAINLLHGLAGLAGFFDEVEFGEVARDLENALVKADESGKLAIMKSCFARLTLTH
jgi:PAS domain S-box-containing protein